MQVVEFLVQGSAPEPYTVTFSKEKDNLNALCTCPAGASGQYCKHRFAILAGDASAVVSANPGDVMAVASWLLGTDLERTLTALADASKEFDRAKERLSDAKKMVAKAMRK